MINSPLNTAILEPKVITPAKKTKNSKHIVLIHGFATDQRCWDLFVNKNKNNYIHLINLPGHGNLTYLRKELEFDFIIEVIKQYILDMDQKNIVLMGHSFGGGISMVVSDRLNQINPEIIGKLILLAPYTKYSIPLVYNKIPLFNVKNASDFSELQKSIFANVPATLHKLKKYFYEEETIQFFQKNSKYLKYIIFQMSRISTFSKIHNASLALRKNTYLLLGENDKFVPSKIIEDKFKLVVPTLYVSIYKNCGHGFFAEQDSYFFGEIEKIVNG